jgi:glucan 1,3-beta-glucosidase
MGVAIFCLWQGRAHYYPDAPDGQFACLSYTPRRDSAQPDVRRQIEIDMQQLASRTRCVRTYSVMNGLDYVPEVARRLHMRVLLGIWIGSNAQANDMEIAHAIEVGNAYRDVIDAIVVGNEVLLRREQNVDALYQMLVRVHAATQLPVTYADVWDFWLKNPRLAEVSDFITIHILPYWDDQPTGIDGAMQQVANLYAKVQQAFPGRHIYVGETGWPSVGRQRESAQPGLLNQARFTREFIAFANQQHIPYNFIEAYDQTWKKELEGTVGGYWGLYDAEGQAKFPLVGAVVADALWWRAPLAGVMIALLLLACSRQRQFKMLTSRALLAGFVWGALCVMQWDYAWQSCRNWQEWSALIIWGLLGHLLFALHLTGQTERWPRLAASVQLALLFGVAYINLGLAFDARYRDFPSLFVLLPVAMLLPSYSSIKTRLGAEAVLLCVWLVLSSLIIVINEGISNGSARWWCALCALLGGSLLSGSGVFAKQLKDGATAHQE